jgi:hypothetical protein
MQRVVEITIIITIIVAHLLDIVWQDFLQVLLGSFRFGHLWRLPQAMPLLRLLLEVVVVFP